MTTQRPIRIANSSGFYGDKFSAVKDMVEGGDIDMLTGDYLAELTMYILHKARLKNPDAGYASTFLSQVEAVLGTCLDRGIRIVSNAGGLNPSGLAGKLGELSTRLGLHPKIAYVDGDDLVSALPSLMAAGNPLKHLDTGEALAGSDVTPVTANAYLGAWPIVHALEAGSDIVVTGRVTDASLVVGPAAWWHGWKSDDFDRLAGAVAAGHIIECGPQATGGNYSFPAEIIDLRYPGFPIAEVADDGSTVITKHENTGGVVSVGTVTAQLLYELQSPAYGGPDVTTWFDSLSVTQEGPDRVLVSGARGTAPTGDIKVAINYTGGYKNSMTLVATGLDIEEKAERAETLLFDLLGGKDQFEATDVRTLRFDHSDSPTQPEASAHIIVTVKDQDPKKVGRNFSNTVMDLMLGSFAGFHTLTPPTGESSYGVYWPTLVPSSAAQQHVVLADGTEAIIPFTAGAGATSSPATLVPWVELVETSPTQNLPLGTLFGARSGDKGGNANIGLWAKTDAAAAWLNEFLTVERLRELVPEASALPVLRYELPNLRALNFIIVGILGEGVASSTRPDPQAKALAEFLRSRFVPIPTALL